MAGGPSTMRLLLRCPDRPGIVREVSGWITEAGGNILDADQHATSPTGDGTFLMRVEFALDGEAWASELQDDAVRALAGSGWTIQVTDARRRPRVAIFCSREDHCLLDLLWRWRRGELDCRVALVVSNHPDHAEEVGRFGVPYVHVPTRDRKPEAEQEVLALLADHQAEVGVLARYMQILSGGFLEEAGIPFINIHHSFLPAFAGAEPYERAWRRGVKLIGATAHYVTEELDAGPIISQDTTAVTHRDDPEDFARLGRDLERVVLARALRAHLAGRVLIAEERTVVF